MITVNNANAAVTLLEQRPEKNFSGSERDSNPRPLRRRCSALPTELSKPHESGRMRVSPLHVDVVLWPKYSIYSPVFSFSLGRRPPEGVRRNASNKVWGTLMGKGAMLGSDTTVAFLSGVSKEGVVYPR